MEYIDVYDKDRKRLGKVYPRGKALLPGEYEITVQVIVFNSNHEMLIQKRQTSKKWFADLWDCSAAGCVVAGENSAEAAQREVKEELGLDFDFTDVRPNMTMSFNTGFSDVYIVHADVPIEDIVIQEEEVQDARWATREEIMELLDQGKFVDYYSGYIAWMFECDGKVGAFKALNA